MSRQERIRNQIRRFNNGDVVEEETRDDVEFWRPTSSGLYAVYPWADTVRGTTGNQKGMFKCGLASTSFNSRFQSYHTDYPMGVYINCLLNVVPKHIDSLKKNVKLWEDFYARYKKHLNEMEAIMFSKLRRDGAVIIKNNMRTRKEGETEWAYTSIFELHKVFAEMQDEFSKTPKYSSLYDIHAYIGGAMDTDAWQKLMKKHKSVVKQEIWFDLSNRVLSEKNSMM